MLTGSKKPGGPADRCGFNIPNCERVENTHMYGNSMVGVTAIHCVEKSSFGNVTLWHARRSVSTNQYDRDGLNAN